MIKLVIFDCFGVILNEGYPNTAKALAKEFGGSWQQYFDVMYVRFFSEASVKKITQAQAWQKTVRYYDLPITWQELRDWHYRLMKLQPNAVILNHSLNQRGYQTLLLSKNTRSQLADVNRRFKLIKLFKHVMNTWEWGLPKASKQTVRLICRRFHVQPREVVYMDDQPSNLVAPKKLGVQCIYFKNFQQAQRELERCLVKG